MNTSYIIGEIPAVFGPIPQVSTQWTVADTLGAMRVRWNVGRMHYTVDPGLYAVGHPDAESMVFVTANYKLSFDHLRKAMQGHNAWILVLDTRGINVWCAAGKGTFGTEELVKRIKVHALLNIVNHRKLILPQLGAVGVSAHEVQRKTGFQVIYGPVRAKDIPAFLDSGLKATREMRKVEFPFWERLKLIPVELTYGRYYLILIPVVFLLLAGLGPHGYSLDDALRNGCRAVLLLFSAYLAGCVLAPALLPWLPFRRFSLKGLFIGWLVTSGFLALNLLGSTIVEKLSWYLMMGAVSSFMAMNFTGTSTYTSLSGVQKEMKTALPLQIGAAAAGLIAWIIARFL